MKPAPWWEKSWATKRPVSRRLTNQSLLVADRNDDVSDFSHDSRSINALLPKSIDCHRHLRERPGCNTARQEVLEAINSGKLLVNYIGHGSVEIWSADDLLDDTTASTLSNGTRLPFVPCHDCLNGFFQDVYTQSLAEALLLSKNGGAVAVWALPDWPNPSPKCRWIRMSSGCFSADLL